MARKPCAVTATGHLGQVLQDTCCAIIKPPTWAALVAQVSVTVTGFNPKLMKRPSGLHRCTSPNLWQAKQCQTPILARPLCPVSEGPRPGPAQTSTPSETSIGKYKKTFLSFKSPVLQARTVGGKAEASWQSANVPLQVILRPFLPSVSCGLQECRTPWRHLCPLLWLRFRIQRMPWSAWVASPVLHANDLCALDTAEHDLCAVLSPACMPKQT